MPKRFLDAATRQKNNIKRNKMSRRLSNILTSHETAMKKENRKFGQQFGNSEKGQRLFGSQQRENCPKKTFKKRESLCVTPIKLQRFSRLPKNKKMLNAEAKTQMKKRKRIIVKGEKRHEFVKRKRRRHYSSTCSPLSPVNKVLCLGPKEIHKALRLNSVRMQIDF